MTSFTPSRRDVVLNRSGLGPVWFSFATQRDLLYGHSDIPLFVSAQPVLVGFFPVCLQHWLMGTLIRARCASSHHVLHLLLTRPPNQDRIQPSSFAFVPVLPIPERVQLLRDLSTFTPSAAPFEQLESQAEGVLRSPRASGQLCGPRRLLLG